MAIGYGGQRGALTIRSAFHGGAVLQWASLFFALSGGVLLVAGFGLLVVALRPPDKPETRCGGLLNDRLREVLERPRGVERFIYRHHRSFGVAIIVGAMTFLIIVQPWLLGAVLPGGSRAQGAMILVWALLAAVLVIGIIVLFRPSSLKGVEALANRWIQLFPTVLTSLQIGVLLLVVGIVCLGVASRMAGA